MSNVWRNWVKIECGGMSAKAVSDRVTEILARPNPTQKRTVIVLQNMASLEGSISHLLQDLLKEMEPHHERACLVDKTGYAKMMMDLLGAGDRVKVFQSEYHLAEETARRLRTPEWKGELIGAGQP